MAPISWLLSGGNMWLLICPAGGSNLPPHMIDSSRSTATREEEIFVSVSLSDGKSYLIVTLVQPSLGQNVPHSNDVLLPA